MLWNENVMFIHAPKTGGMSLTKMFLEKLPGKVFTTGPEDVSSFPNVTRLDRYGRHATLAEAYMLAALKGRDLSSFERIFVVMRCPYTLEISRYNYLRLGHEWDRGLAQTIAMSGSFKDYLGAAPFFGFSPPRLDLYYHIMDKIPDNLKILRFEDLAEDVAHHVSPFLQGNSNLSRQNVTGNSVFDEYYDAETEALCFERHRWFFDNGFYTRSV